MTVADPPTSDPLEEERSALLTDLQRALRRAQRKVRNIERDLEHATKREQLRAQAQLIVANLHRLKDAKKGSEIEVLDYGQTPPGPVRFKLDANQTAQEKSEALFKRAKKLERTERVAQERLVRAQEQVARLLQATSDAEQTESIKALAALRRTYRVPPRQAPPQQRQKQNAERAPFRSFCSGAFEIRVGRGAKENDSLTLHNSKPYDLWLHVRGTPGSHIILRLRRGQEPPPEALLDAATLAVHFSSARQKHAAYRSPVEVQYTERRFVRKVRHAPPGQVLVQREKVILLEVEPARLKRLLESET